MTANQLMQPKAKRRKRHIGRVLAACFVLLLAIGAAYEAANEAVDSHRYPPPGQLVEMNGYTLHLYCTGEGSPTVILEGGLGGGVVTWPLVQPAVARSTRVCSYDRPGWAWSGGPVPQSGADIVRSLHTLLNNAGEAGPYILVGHSVGGLYSQLYAATYSDEVAGMVLVEARHQDFARRTAAAGQGSSEVPSWIGPLLTRLGITRLLGRMGSLAKRLPPGMMEIALRPSSQRSASNEQRLLPEVEQEVRAAQLRLGDKPVTVITQDPALSHRPELSIWLETQQLYLSLSTRSRLVEAKGSGHLVPYDNPETVTEAITDMVKAVHP